MISILVTGGRHYADRAILENTLDYIARTRNVGIVITGGATGADELAKEWALDRRIPHADVPAYWTLQGFSAGPKRNSAMLLLKPDLVIAFPGNKGTKDMTTKATAAGIRVEHYG